MPSPTDAPAGRLRSRIAAVGFALLAAVVIGLLLVSASRPLGDAAPAPTPEPDTPEDDEPTELRGRAVDPAAGAAPVDESATRPRAVISGTVVDDDTGSPVGGALVTRVGTDAERIRTDERGRFSLPAPEGPVRLMAWSVGYLPHEQSVTSPAAVKVRLRRGGSITGTVVDQFERPLPHARVVARGAGGADFRRRPWDVLGAGMRPVFGTADADEHGAFVLSGLPPGETVRLEVIPAGHLHPTMSSGGHAVEVGDDVVLYASVVVRATIRAVDETTGELVPHATLIFEASKRGEPFSYPKITVEAASKRAFPWGGVQTVALAPRRPDERFAFAVDVEAPGYRSRSVPIELGAAGDREFVVELEPLEGVEVRQRHLACRWASGDPYTGLLHVDCRRSSRKRLHHVLVRFSDGRSVAPLPIPSDATHVRILGTMGTYWGKDVRVEQSVAGLDIEDDVAFVLRGAEVRLEVVDASSGARLEQLTLRGPSGLFAGEDGLVTFHADVIRRTGTGWPFPAGTHRITIGALGYRDVQHTVTVPASGEPVVLRVPLERASSTGR